MQVYKCPLCGRPPKITECRPHKGNRRRMCQCPALDSVIPYPDHINRPWFIYVGDGDDNAIFKVWNQAIERYKSNSAKRWFDRDFSPWTNDSHLER